VGAQNVAKVFTYWTHLGHRDTRALVYMANVSLDADQPPLYFGGWEALAVAMGLSPDRDDPNESARKQIVKALKVLTDAGVVVSTGAARRGVRAEYALALDPTIAWRCTGLRRDQSDGILKGTWEKANRSSPKVQRHQNGVPTWDQNGVATRHQNGPEPDTKTVPPRSTEEPPKEQARNTSPQAVKSPGPVDNAAGLTESQNRERQLKALREKFPDQIKDGAA